MNFVFHMDSLGESIRNLGSSLDANRNGGAVGSIRCPFCHKLFRPNEYFIRLLLKELALSVPGKAKGRPRKDAGELRLVGVVLKNPEQNGTNAVCLELSFVPAKPDPPPEEPRRRGRPRRERESDHIERARDLAAVIESPEE